MSKRFLALIGVAIVCFFTYFVFYYEPPEWPDMGRDMCAYERAFTNCMILAKSSGMTGDHIVSQCSDAGQSVALRRKKHIKPECLQ